MIRFSLTAPLPSGKNQVGIAWRNGKVIRYPNKRFVQWREQAGKELLAQVKNRMPLMGTLHMSVSYWPPDRVRRDVPGMLDALFHLLEHCWIVKDDSQISDVQWVSEPYVRPAHPKMVIAEISLERQP